MRHSLPDYDEDEPVAPAMGSWGWLALGALAVTGCIAGWLIVEGVLGIVKVLAG